MTKITLDNLKIWRDNSLATARDLQLLEEPILECLAEVPLVVKGSRTHFYNLYGNVTYKGQNSKVFVYERNLAQFFPDYLRDIINQSGMDHELIGHLGFYFSENKRNESIACVVQQRMALERGKEDSLWFAVSKLLPYFMRIHRQVRLDAYSATNLINLPQLKFFHD